MIETDKWEDIKNDFPYLDILYLEHPTSKKHPRQSLSSRAGQFAPFAALTGYEEGVAEVVRHTSKKIDLTEEEKEKLDIALKIINSDKNTMFKVTYFVKDKRKKGGKYLTTINTLNKIDTYNKQLVLSNKERIPLKDIVKIDIITTQE